MPPFLFPIGNYSRSPCSIGCRDRPEYSSGHATHSPHTLDSMNDAVRSDSSPVLAVDAGQSSTRVRCEPGPWGPGWIVTSSGVRTALPLAQQFATIMHDVATAHPEITRSECTVAIGSSGPATTRTPFPSCTLSNPSASVEYCSPTIPSPLTSVLSVTNWASLQRRAPESSLWP